MAITSDKLIKSLMIVRSIYILAIAVILMNLVSFYGLAISLSRMSSSAKNDLTLINVDKAVFSALLVIVFITVGYVVIEYMFRKKLQSYPLELTDKVYSKKTILFLSYLYLVFFFFLNYLIASLLINQGYSNIRYIISYTSLNLVTIYVVYRCLVKKINNKKTWIIFGIVAFILSYIMPSHLIDHYLFVPYVVPFFTASVLFFIKCISFWKP